MYARRWSEYVQMQCTKLVAEWSRRCIRFRITVCRFILPMPLAKSLQKNQTFRQLMAACISEIRYVAVGYRSVWLFEVTWLLISAERVDKNLPSHSSLYRIISHLLVCFSEEKYGTIAIAFSCVFMCVCMCVRYTVCVYVLYALYVFLSNAHLPSCLWCYSSSPPAPRLFVAGGCV